MIRASAPGSIMITGEHAVVYGHKAIVAAIEQRITVELTPRDDRVVTIASAIADPLETRLDDLAEGGAYRFVLAAIAMHQSDLPQGFDLDITSEINPTLGLGSSAAVTVATLGAIQTLAKVTLDQTHQKALKIVRDIQGRGSGADLAASFMGGMLTYRAQTTADMSPLPSPPPLSLKDCGYKTPTAVVLADIAARMEGNEAHFAALYEDMGQTAQQAIDAAQTQNWSAFAAALTRYQEHMQALGVCDDTLANIIAEARADRQVLAAKISGSGLGDCVVAVGAVPEGFVPVKVAQTGLEIHD